MKKIIYLSILVFSNYAYSQVAIGKENVEGSGIMDFGNQNKGIILPIIEVDPSGVYSNGTLAVDQTDKKVKVYQNGAWLELSDEGSFDIQLDGSNNPTTTAANINTSGDVGEGVVIGSETASVDGVLVLEATDKALILPKVANPHLTILSPVAGTMVYDTYSNSLAVFDGMVWSYWR